MAYPPAYVRAYSFTDFETTNPGEPKPGNKLDTEYDAVANALTATQTALALIQRADGALANESVGVDQLQAGLFDGIADVAVADAEAAAAAAASSAAAAAGSASAAATSATDATTQAGIAAGSAATAGVSQSIAQGAAVDAADSAADADNSADVAVAAANDTAGSVAATEAAVQRAFEWAELLTGPVLPAPPGWPEAVDDGMFSSKWWAIRARDFNSTDTIDLGPGGEADIGEAFDNWDAIPGNDLGLGQTFAQWGTPPHTYILIDRDNPSDPASWTDITGGPGPPGPANSLSIGAVTTGAVGQPAAATITGAAPNQVLNLTLPTGATGPAGPTGAAGPPNALAIGTVTTGAPGSPAGATITGTAPTQTLNLTIPQGPQGIQGIQGIQGPPGAGLLADPTALVGLAAVPGTSLAALRADGAPALSQAITPSWTGLHSFTANTGAAGGSWQIVNNAPTFVLWVMSEAVNARAWYTQASGANYYLGVMNDGVSAVKNALQITRAVTTVTNLSFGNAADNPTYNFLGTGAASFGGAVNTGRLTVSVPDGAIVAEFTSPSGKLRYYAYSGGSAYIQAHNLASSAQIPLVIDSMSANITGPIYESNGTVAAPAYSFLNDPDTGMYTGAGDNTLRFTTGGSITFYMDSANNRVISYYSMQLATDGSLGAPSYTWTSDTDTGLFRRTNNQIGLTCGGVLVAVFDQGQANFLSTSTYVQDGTVGQPGLTFNNDTDTGILRYTLNTLAISAGATAVALFNPASMILTKPIYAIDGSAAVPSYSFDNNTDTGMYRGQELNAEAIGFSCAGVGTMYVAPNAIVAGSSTTKFYAQDVGYFFISDQDTGFSRPGSDTIAVTVGNTYGGGWKYAGGNPQYLANDGSGGLPSISFDSDPDSGFFHTANANEIALSTGGGARLTLNTTNITSSLNISAPTFTTTSSRTIKRETGAPSRPANILARLRPLLYRLLDGDDREQLGLIAEEVHDVCPQLSDGKTVAYDRLAILLLAAWQDEHLEAA